MKPLLIFLAAIMVTVLLGSCRKDYYAEKKIDPNTKIYFEKDVQPLFTKNCAIAGCHVSGGHVPNLSEGLAYDQLLGLGYVDTTNAEGSPVYKLMTATSKPMPPSGKLSSYDINLVLAWIKQGAQNN